MRINKHTLVAAAVAFLSAPALASAQSIFDDSVSSCTTENCSSVRIPAHVFAIGASAGAFTIDAFAAPGECVRFDLVAPFHPAPDMELVVVAPNGTVFRNDDRNGVTDRRPLIKIASAPNSGWYTVHVAQFAGTATETNILLLYGRYPSGNVNCGGATGPSLATESLTTHADELDTVEKVESPVPAPKRGQTGAAR
jgi:hypothetical protein